ncbi:hypothetical protein HQ587_06330 [bacterium]|nr:hypothetical protein [bacterium]
MKKCFIVVFLIVLCSDTGFASEKNFNWWGLVSFRHRLETYKKYIDIRGSTTRGDLKETDRNAKTRLGYKFGFTVDLNEYISAAITLRSGMGKVMCQDINNENENLFPGLLEAYIDWKPPYAEALLGRIPQKGNAMWDLYAASNNLRDPLRQDNPCDGVFNDKMGYLNGIRIIAPVGPVTLWGLYHTDYVSGFKTEFPEEGSDSEVSPQLDQRIYLGGFSVDIGESVNRLGVTVPQAITSDLTVEAGLPYRVGDIIRSTTRDSLYAREKIWGATLNAEAANFTTYNIESLIALIISYGYNWREDDYRRTYLDNKISAGILGFIFTGKYQICKETNKLGIYAGEKIQYSALHFYLNKTIWGLDIQPRYIMLEKKVANNKTTTTERYEVTTTIRF